MLKKSLNFETLASYEQGDIVVADLLYAEQIGVKRRLAIVISNSEYNKESEDLILLKITSKDKGTSFDIELTNKDLEEGELFMDSYIMVDNPMTTYVKNISQKAGKISLSKLKEVKQKIKELYKL